MGIRCIINLDDLTAHGPIDITYSIDDDDDTAYVFVPGWQGKGEMFELTVEFDFNSWGGNRVWLMPWLVRNKVPFRMC